MSSKPFFNSTFIIFVLGGLGYSIDNAMVEALGGGFFANIIGFFILLGFYLLANKAADELPK
jgi:hypothetical protein